jgi:hypothetical protein
MPARKLPPNDEVVAMYNGGLSSSEIADKCGVKPVTVVSLLTRLGVPRRGPSEADRISRSRGRKPIIKFWEGKTQTPEMVESRISKIRGENHYLWKDGMSRRRYRGVVAKEKCEECGAIDNLGIHHLDDDHYNNDPENLQVLCVSCHMSTHKTAYWKAKREGRPTPKSNGPVGWTRKEPNQ